MIADVPLSSGSPSSSSAFTLTDDAIAPIVDGSSTIEAIVLTIDRKVDENVDGDVDSDVDRNVIEAPADWPLSTAALDAGPWACVARTGVSLRLDDLADVDEATATELEAAGVERLACRPVWVDDRLTGVAIAFGEAADAIDLDPDVAGSAPVEDELTGVASSGGLQDEIDTGDGDAVVLYVDLDGLDRVNDAYGSRAGDAVLVEVARRLVSVTRDADRVFRMTGDEFVVVVRGAEQLESIQTAADVIDELALPYAVVGPDGANELVSVTAGVGMCVPSEGTPFDLAVFTALSALGEAKSAGSHRLHIVGR